MARLARNAVVTGHRLFHVTARGVERRAIVLDDRDRHSFVRLLRLVIDRHDWRVHAYCLMDTHVHLVVETDPSALSRGMHRLLFRHAQAFNLRHRRWGHLFGDRFAVRVIESDRYLGAACGYVADNPVRAGLCARRSDWPWASTTPLQRRG